MASTRLTNNHRKQIVENLLDDVFPPMKQEIDDLFGDWAYRMYAAHVDQKVRNRAVSAGVVNWLPVMKCVDCSSLFSYNDKVSAGFKSGYVMPSVRPPNFVIPVTPVNTERFSLSNQTLNLDTQIMDRHPELFEALKVLMKRRREMIKEKEQVKSKAESILMGVTTVKNLLDIWPECKPYIPEEVLNPSPKAMIPVSQVAEFADKIRKLKED